MNKSNCQNIFKESEDQIKTSYLISEKNTRARGLEKTPNEYILE